MSETLTQFGTSFQAKIIASLMCDIKFLQSISEDKCKTFCALFHTSIMIHVRNWPQHN